MKDDQLIVFKKSLLFLHVDELKEVATQLSLSDKGNKMAIILRILHFMQTGQRLVSPRFPEESCAKKGAICVLDANALMLKGVYKNDLKTRLFFKQLIGPHFHFTAFGIDWLNERWMKGDPPTYQEFAVMWQEESQKRREIAATPKEEWAYIHFVQQFLLMYPIATRESVNRAWNEERQKHKDRIADFLRSLKELMIPFEDR